MSRKAAVKKSSVYKIDLTQIDGDGAFPCPKCGIKISPEDESEEVYKIIKTKAKGDELAELILICNKCESKIKLVGAHKVGGGINDCLIELKNAYAIGHKFWIRVQPDTDKAVVLPACV